MNGLQNIISAQAENCLYPFFWQHGESGEILAHYMDKIAESGMGAVCIEARRHPDFVGPGWWDNMDVIVKKAKELGMKVWILDDAHFPTGYANGRIVKDYPQYLKLYLDIRRFDVQGPMTQARADLKLLKGRPGSEEETDCKVLGVYMAKRCSQETMQGDPIAADTLQDITDQMRQTDRLLTLDVPAGAYSIFVVYLTHKGAEAMTKDYLNPLVQEATQVLIDEVYEAHFARYGEEFGKTICGFFSDEPRFGNCKGTEARIGHMNMPLPWREGLENELGFDRKYLPLLWTPADGAESEIRFRYMDVVTRLYNENFTEVLGNWCREHGVIYAGHTIEDNGAHARLGYGTGHYFRGQQGMDLAGVDVIGGQIVPGMNYHHDAFSTGGSNGEFYHYALAKLASSAAHLDPRKKGRALCEAFGAYGWNEGLKMMKWIADHLMVRGINYIVPHAFDPHEFPDWDCPPHFYAHGHNPQFRYFKYFTDYVNRVMSLFRDGIHPARAGLFYPAEQEWAGEYMPAEKPARELTTHQISFDFESRDYLKMACTENGVCVINGERFEALVFPYGKYIPADIVPILNSAVQAGVKLIFLEAVPESTVGGTVSLENIKKFAKVVRLKELGSELEDYRSVETNRVASDLVIGEYCRGNKHFYMLFHENIGEVFEGDVKFRADEMIGNRYLYRYDAFNDTLYCEKEKASGCHICLQPYESAIYIMSGEVIPGAEQMPAECDTEAALPEKWRVSFADSSSYPEFCRSVETEKLGLIQQIEGWDDRAGTVRYTAEFEVQRMERAVLDLGEVHETAEVFVNGQSAGCRLCRPYTFELGALLQEGKNELAIEVTNTLGTEQRDAISHYLVIEPFGVEGPVTLKIQ